MEQQALDHFGELLMRRVRDEVIDDWDMIINGRMRGESAQHVRAKLSAFGPHQVDVLRWLIPQIVDTTLHDLLWWLEQEKSVDVAVKTPSGVIPSIREVSDGLAGELYTDRGWIARFSRKPHVEP